MIRKATLCGGLLDGSVRYYCLTVGCLCITWLDLWTQEYGLWIELMDK